MAHPGNELDIEFLQAHGVRICLQMHLPILAALKFTHDTMKALRDEQDQDQIIKNSTSPNLTKVSIRDKGYRRWIELFLTP